MKDFQSYLKSFFEAEEMGPAPGGTIESATTPIQAYLAYRRELNDMMTKVQGTLEKVEIQMDAIQGKVGGYLDTAKSKAEIGAQTAAFTPTKARPVINRNRNAALVDKYAPPQQGEAQ